VEAVLDERGCTRELFAGAEIRFPPYERDVLSMPDAARMVESVRTADAVVIGSLGYHGSLAGVAKNALDHLEAL
jgi:FMN reductase